MLLIALIVVVGCSSGKEKDTPKDNDVGIEDNGNDDEKEKEDSPGGTLRLGETGTLNTTIGDYEVTPVSFEIVDKPNGIEPYNEGHIFVIVDTKIKNIGDDTLEGADLTSSTVLADDDDRKSDNHWEIDIVNHFEGELKPGEEMSGQLLFQTPPSDHYALIFGYALETVSNEVVWRFDADEAK